MRRNDPALVKIVVRLTQLGSTVYQINESPVFNIVYESNMLSAVLSSVAGHFSEVDRTSR